MPSPTGYSGSDKKTITINGSTREYRFKSFSSSNSACPLWYQAINIENSLFGGSTSNYRLGSSSYAPSSNNNVLTSTYSTSKHKPGSYTFNIKATDPMGTTITSGL